MHAELPCAMTERFSVLSESVDESALLKRVTQSSAIDFELKFGAMPLPTIIVPTEAVNSNLNSRLKANGYFTIMPWISTAERNKMRKQGIIKQIEEQLEGRPQVIKDAAIASALEQLKSQMPTKEDSIDLTALSHELGHKWFMSQYKKDNDEEQPGHAYGGWAPDWLDESAAIAMESESLKQRRRDAFTEIDPENRIQLAQFLSMDHPAAQAARDLARKFKSPPLESGASTRTTTNQIVLLSGKEAEDFIAASGGDITPNFYAQALVFSDYLEARSATDKILSHISAGLAEGQTFTTWLADNTFSIPQDLDALERDWLEYSDQL